jgi:signal transduction histidine kinase
MKVLTRDEMHELRSAIGAVAMAVEVVAPSVPKDTQHFFEIINRGIGRCLSILKDETTEKLIEKELYEEQ